MSICDDYSDWNALSPPLDDLDTWNDQERDRLTELMSNAINSYLTAHEYEPVQVTHGPLDNALAQTDPVTGNITFDDNYLLKADRDDAYQTAFHEAWHTMTRQDGTHDLLSDDERQAINELISEEGSDQEFGYAVPEHGDADLFGDYVSGLIAEECAGPLIPPKPRPPDPYGASDGWNFNDINWDEVKDPDDAADEADDIEFEMDEGNVVVTDASDSEFDIVMDEENVAVTTDYSASELDDLEGPAYEEDDFEETSEDFQEKITEMDLEIDIENAAVSSDNSENEFDDTESEIATQNVEVLSL